jgi:hypothetical protein
MWCHHDGTANTTRTKLQYVIICTRRLGLRQISMPKIKISPKLQVLLFIGLRKLLLQGYLALFLIFLLKSVLEPLLFLLALQDHTIMSKNHMRGHLLVGLMPCLFHLR